MTLWFIFHSYFLFLFFFLPLFVSLSASLLKFSISMIGFLYTSLSVESLQVTSSDIFLSFLLDCPLDLQFFEEPRYMSSFVSLMDYIQWNVGQLFFWFSGVHSRWLNFFFFRCYLPAGVKQCKWILRKKEEEILFSLLKI